MNDDQRLRLRPQIVTLPSTSEEESFQNNTLRPVCKLQNELLQSTLQMFLRKRKVDLQQTPKAQRFAKVKELVTRDNRLRGLLFGIVVGQFTAEEMSYYVANDGVVNRRITNLLVERLQ